MEYLSSEALTRLLDFFRVLAYRLPAGVLPQFAPLIPLLTATTARHRPLPIVLRSVDILIQLLRCPQVFEVMCAPGGLVDGLLPLLTAPLNALGADYYLRHHIIRFLASAVAFDSAFTNQSGGQPTNLFPLPEFISSQDKNPSRPVSLVSRLILLLEQLFHHFSSIEENKQPSDAQINLVAESLRLLLLM